MEEKMRKYVVEAPELKPGQKLCSGGIKTEDGKFTNLYKNPVPYSEPPKIPTRRIQRDEMELRDAYRRKKNSMRLEAALYAGRYISELPSVRRRIDWLADKTIDKGLEGIGWFFGCLFTDTKQNKNRQENRIEQNSRQTKTYSQPESSENVDKKGIEEFKRQGKIIEFPNKKVI